MEENEDEDSPLLHVKKESDHILGENITADATREICLFVGQVCVSKVEVSKSNLLLANHCCRPGIHSRDNFGTFIFKRVKTWRRELKSSNCSKKKTIDDYYLRLSGEIDGFPKFFRALYFSLLP